MTRPLLSAVAALWLFAEGALLSAQAPLRIELGEGVAVHGHRVPCWGVAFVPPTCHQWTPAGFSFGELHVLHEAITFARVPRSGRIVALYLDRPVAPGVPAQQGASPPPLVLPPIRFDRTSAAYTDDLGGRWRETFLPGPQIARALAFDATSSFGVAAGDGGGVWTTEDGGATWTRRRGGAEPDYVDVHVLGHAVVLVDARGATWRLWQGRGNRTQITSERPTSVRTEADAIVVRTARRVYRVARGGEVLDEPR
ncbi:MAG: hypothetical protein KF901_12845 [Myxococcales bacterium]|nr:hypothetical protein [Myxococcales bacterium]